MNQDMKTLGFDQIIEQLKANAVSVAAAEILAETAPILNESISRNRMAETTEARKVLEISGNPPLAIMNGLEEAVTQAAQGGMLQPEQLTETARFMGTVRRLKRYLQNAETGSPMIASWQTELPSMEKTAESIECAIREDEILNEASPALHDIRRRKENKEQAIREKMNQVLFHQKDHLADNFITTRNGHFVVPVLKRFQSMFPGRVIDISAKGTTVFMEPNAVAVMQQELDQIADEEYEEERRILWELSGLVADAEEDLRRSIRTMTDLDVLFARAKLGLAMHAEPAELTTERYICLKQARHPLLDPERCVPLDMELKAPECGIAVTGPNTGGKTVTLKTVGLMCMMAQSGLHIPCGEGTVIPLTDAILCDIGDSQSISQNLSTFSGHMTNVIRILGECSRDSLVLLDELGSGTDPAEGTGLATAILEEILRRKCLFMVTTHDPDIKKWAEITGNVVSARMAFDEVSLAPMYILELGRSGESCAIEITRRLGMDESILRRARQVVNGDRIPTDNSGHFMRIPASRLKRREISKEGDYEHFTMGDSVMRLPDQVKGIVYRPADENGIVIVQFPDEKISVPHKRLKLLVPAAELYPPDYDFSIIFETVANRKATHTMSRKHDPNAVVVHREGNADHYPGQMEEE